MMPGIPQRKSPSDFHAYRYAIIVLLAGMPMAGSALAAEGDAITPYVTAGIIHDSNLFRLSEDVDARLVLGRKARSDTIRRLGVGVDMDLKLSRQHFVLNASVVQNRFRRFDTLDYDDRDLRAIWKWRVGNQWNGRIGSTYATRLSGFDNLQQNIRDLKTTRENFIEGAYLFHPAWKLRAVSRSIDIEHSLDSRRNLDQEKEEGVIGLDYTSRAGNRLGVQGRFADATYPNRVLTATSIRDNAYREYELGVRMDWNRSGHSRIRARLGYLQRDHEHLSAVDYSGMVARLEYEWSVTAKTLLTIKAWQDISTSDESTAVSVTERGVSLDPAWFPTARLGLQGQLAYTTRDYRGDTGVDIDREDAIRSLSLSLAYQPSEHVQVQLGYRAERRTSTRTLADYRYSSGLLNLNVIF